LRPYVVAELSANHNGSLDRALDLVDLAAYCGCDAIKLQTYTPDDITIDYPFQADGLWRGQTLYNLYKQAQTPWEWHKYIFDRARTLQLDCISTPFSLEAVDFLEQFDLDAYKIASFENNWLDLIRYVARKGKPMYISLGMATADEVGLAWQHSVAQSMGMVRPTLLHCISAYPAKLEDMHLANITDIKRWMPSVRVGLSDHSLGHEAAVIATVLGAEVIEKHLCLRREDGGPDAEFSLEPHEMADLVRAVREVGQIVGVPAYGPRKGENAFYRRSLIATKDIGAGEPLSAGNVAVLRPNVGLPPEALGEVVGRVAKHPIARGQGIAWQDLV
jgi:N-acetylneuraminate synthase